MDLVPAANAPAPFDALLFVADRCLSQAKTEAAATSMSPVSPTSSTGSSTSHGQPVKPRSRPPKNRETHNKKEKQRRDNLRGMLNELRRILNACGEECDFSKASVLNLLKSTTSKITALVAEGRKLATEHDMLMEKNRMLRNQLMAIEAGTQHAPTPPAQDETADINVTDHVDSESGTTHLSESSRLRAVMTGTMADLMPPRLATPICTSTMTSQCLELPAFPSLPMTSASSCNLFRDLAGTAPQPNVPPAMSYVFPGMMPLPMPTAQTSTFTSFNVPHIPQHFLASLQTHAS